jgi:predicted hydrocarbon binding protein
MENEILKNLYFDRDKGGLFFKEVRYLLIRPETLIVLQKLVEEELGEKASQILFKSGFAGGSLSSKKYRDVFKLSNEDIIHFIIEMGSHIGWGRFELEELDLSLKRLVVRVYHSAFAESYGTSPTSVCHFIRGVLSGMASVIFEKEIEAKELSCLAKNDTSCRFEIM